MNRRGFLGSILAACAAPAIVRADSLMRIVPLDTTVWTVTAKGRDSVVLPSSPQLGDRIIARYYLPFDVSPSPLIEGVAPFSRGLQYEDITMTVHEWRRAVT